MATSSSSADTLLLRPSHSPGKRPEGGTLNECIKARGTKRISQMPFLTTRPSDTPAESSRHSYLGFPIPVVYSCIT